MAPYPTGFVSPHRRPDFRERDPAARVAPPKPGGRVFRGRHYTGNGTDDVPDRTRSG